MTNRAGLVLTVLTIAAAACSGGSSSSSGPGGPSPDGGGAGEGGTGSDGGAMADGGSTADGGSPDGSSPGADASTDGGSKDGGSTVKPGNGCPAALGIDAGFYTCVTQYFVSPSGSDSNPGTSMASPLATIGAATRLALVGGACVTVADGTYDETVLVTTPGSAETCTGYVVFRSASPGGAKVVSTDAYNGFMVNASFVMVDGFDLQDTSTGSAFTAGTNTLQSGSGKVIVYHHIAAVRNIAHDSGGAGLGALHADYVRFEGNTVYRNSSRSTYGDSGIDLWEMQASDTLPGFHIVIRNNFAYSNVESDIPANLQTDGEGIILDSFDYADPAYGTTPYAQESLVENNVLWGNGGRGIEASGAQPTSHVTIRNNTLFDDVIQQQQYGGSEIVSWGNGNTVTDNLVILGPDAQDGTAANQTTVAIADRCGPSSAGVQITGGSVWDNNLVYSMKTGAPLTSSNCVTTPSNYTTIPTGSNLLGVDPTLAAQTASPPLTIAGFTIGATNPAAHAGTSTSFAPFDYAYVVRPQPPSIGAFEP